MPTGGAKLRRWTLRENRSRYETEAHAFRRWVLSLYFHNDVKGLIEKLVDECVKLLTLNSPRCFLMLLT